MFSVQIEKLEAPDAEASVYIIPWDSEIFGVPVAELDSIRFKNHRSGIAIIEEISAWADRHDVHLFSTRIAQHEMQTALLLQEHGFRAIEINYRPFFGNLQETEFEDYGFQVLEADETDMERLIGIAGRVFSAGRFHNDPRIGPTLGNKRYATWMRNSYTHPRQKIEKIVEGDRLVGAFVTELRDNGAMMWWLTVLAEEFMGKGVAKPTWMTMMSHAKRLGANAIETSISSHNMIVQNLYVSLGYRFTEPLWSLHWLRKSLPGSENP